VYAGDWKYDSRDGHGTAYLADGSKYEGGWKEGERSGRGRMMYANGDVYEGDWEHDGRSGIGSLRLACGDRYEGHWMGDEKEGPGVYYFHSTGKMYEGEWARGVAKCGQIRDDADASSGGNGGVVVEEPFEIPKLELDKPEAVLAEAIARIRQKRVRDEGHGGEGRREVVQEEEEEGEGEQQEKEAGVEELDLEQIYEAFQSLVVVVGVDGPQGDAATIACGQVVVVLDRLGLEVDEGWLQQFFDSIQANPDTRITFSELVDVIAIILDGE